MVTIVGQREFGSGPSLDALGGITRMTFAANHRPTPFEPPHVLAAVLIPEKPYPFGDWIGRCHYLGLDGVDVLIRSMAPWVSRASNSCSIWS